MDCYTFTHRENHRVGQVQKAVFFASYKSFIRLCLGLLSFFSACQPKSGDRETETIKLIGRDSLYFSKEIFSNLKLDSIQLVHFLDSTQGNRSEKEAILLFYQKRQFQFAWLENNALSPAAHDFFLRYQDFISDYADSSLVDSQLDSLLYQLASEGPDSQDKSFSDQLEMRLSLTFFRFAKKEFTGLIENPEALLWHIPKYKKNYPALLDSLAEGRRPGLLKEPANSYYSGLKAALSQYKSLIKSGHWPTIPTWRPDSSKNMDEQAAWLKKCLVLLQDLRAKDTLSENKDALKKALLTFQKRNGLKETGVLDQATHKQLQMPLSQRLIQIMVNLERLRWLPEKIQGDFLLVNIPEFELHVFKNGKPLWNSKIVVGKEANKTQVFKGKISHIIINPYWAVPPGIVKKEVLPGLKKHRNYLRRHNMKVYAGNTPVNAAQINWHKYSTKIPYTIRQMPGKDNPLGKLKFLFPNSFWIYLHDSNEPWRFEAQKRTFSHGCIRVEKAEQLAAYLFEKNSGMSLTHIKKVMAGKSEAYYKLKQPEPVYIVYLTSWVDENGDLNFRPDIYGRDSLLALSVFGKLDK